MVEPGSPEIPGRPGWAKLGRDTVIAAIAFAYSLWAIWGAGEEWLAKGFMLLLFGIPVYVWLKWRQSTAVQVPAKPVPLAEPITPEHMPARLEA